MAILKIMTPGALKTWRAKHGYTQQRLADALGVFQETIARWEIGTRKIPSFLALALLGLEVTGGEPLEKGHTKTKKGRRKRHGSDLPKR